MAKITWKRRRQMAADRAVSMSTEKRLQARYPDQYPKMVEITPGVKACTEEDDEKFNEFLYDRETRLSVLKGDLA